MFRSLFFLMIGILPCLEANTISLNTGTAGAPWTVQSASGNVLMVIGTPSPAWATATAALSPAQWVGVKLSRGGGNWDLHLSTEPRKFVCLRGDLQRPLFGR
jgi:hypothetical protein